MKQPERKAPAQCKGTGISVPRSESSATCIVVTDHPSGLCGFCRKTERLCREWDALVG